jgi:hypothetical protein
VLSVVRRPLSNQDLHLLYLLTLVDEDDPLEGVTLAEWADRHREDLARELDEHGGRYKRPPPTVIEGPVPGLVLAVHLGASSLLLLVAAVLLTQCFARRPLAFVMVLLAIVLYVAALDRLAVGTHAGMLTSVEAPLPGRIVASQCIADTFFYRGLARTRLEAVAKDERAPSSLRTSAEVSLNVLR